MKQDKDGFVTVKETQTGEAMEVNEKEIFETGTIVEPEVKKITERASSKTLDKVEEDDFNKLVDDTMKGKHGTGRERMLSLGSDYAAVQKEIAKRLANNKK